MTTDDKDDNRYGDLPYDDVFDADGNLIKPVSINVTLAALKRLRKQD